MATQTPGPQPRPFTRSGGAAQSKLPVSPWAIASCALALIAALFLFSSIGFVLAIIAVTAGFAARRGIKAGIKAGDRWAGVGIAVGFLVIVLKILGFFVSVTT